MEIEEAPVYVSIETDPITFKIYAAAAIVTLLEMLLYDHADSITIAKERFHELHNAINSKLLGLEFRMTPGDDGTITFSIVGPHKEGNSN